MACEHCGKQLPGPVCNGKDGCGRPAGPAKLKELATSIGAEPKPDCKTDGQAQCGRCFVCSMVGVFRAVRRVLRDDGTLWLNLGDSYSGGSRGASGPPGSSKQESNRGTVGHRSRPKNDLPGGNLVGVPWRVALALQADGWVLRCDMPWVKRSSMPESTKNRPAKALEYWFMLTKGMDYYFDMNAVRKPFADERNGQPGAFSQNKIPAQPTDGEPMRTRSTSLAPSENLSGRNFRNADLWFQSVETPHGLVGLGDELVGLDVTARGYEGAHFACYPEKLIEPLVLASTSERGACPECGTPWQRQVEEIKLTRERPNDYVKRTGAVGTGNSCANTVAGVEVKTIGWQPGCECVGRVELGEDGDTEHHTPYAPVPCVVLDPFIGSGTTCLVAAENGRHGWGVDLSREYLLTCAVPRITSGLMARPGMAGLVARPVKAVRF